jgi:BirA family transcriptional regulator, biotin operon repressor / biotin---[acetyl-CoA-carboxylase] ligase
MSRLRTSFIGHKIFCYDTLDSIIDAARREALWGAPAGTVIIVSHQRLSEGQSTRNWLTLEGNLAFSVILRPNIEFLPQMVMLSSLAVCNSIRTVTRLRAFIKWPSDIVINEKKIACITIETDIRKNSLKHCIINIGINVNLHAADLTEIAATATSLSDQLGKPVSRQDMLVLCLNELENLYKLLPQTDYIFEQWQKNMLTLGQKVQVSWKDSTLTGIAEAFTHDGDLLVREANGSLKQFKAADVSLA